ncbi:MAG: hypothetical protein ACPG9K_01030 [Poseidonibacter sp.]
MTQREYIENYIRKHGSISRNHCLREFISRAGAIICDMNSNGYVIEGKTVKGSYLTRWGMQNDYVYTLKHKPKNKIYSKEGK